MSRGIINWEKVYKSQYPLREEHISVTILSEQQWFVLIILLSFPILYLSQVGSIVFAFYCIKAFYGKIFGNRWVFAWFPERSKRSLRRGFQWVLFKDVCVSAKLTENYDVEENYVVEAFVELAIAPELYESLSDIRFQLYKNVLDKSLKYAQTKLFLPVRQKNYISLVAQDPGFEFVHMEGEIMAALYKKYNGIS